MKKSYTWIGIALLLILSACGQGSNSPTTGSGGEEEVSDWSYDVKIDQVENEMDVTMTVTNHQDNESNLDFSSGQKYEIILRDESGEEVYRYSEGKMFTMALVIETVSPGESLSFTEKVSLEGLEVGEYELEAELLIIAIDGEELEDRDMFKEVLKVEIE
ncbi:BsuPI-related putative proteinase inhibitor [Alkalihalobacillus hemicellulosilyticus]|uniref:Intracellular proteinase inhibitor n=1 Tax=Halalkalibacter hemicellulosilyticusJCM 9152 TaxID=1236971 RepID=W4QGI0_9BACI|nr:BsuPI-related putative proteinase inhibitor [Halalkalibacter hemicellulosilyticus]GAE31196.1 intracellular proteinase inhibitor [Halalkalibacter hemicellulosilyticusJCM 9152]